MQPQGFSGGLKPRFLKGEPPSDADVANVIQMYVFNRPWSDGTTGIKLSALELLEKLSALVPLPRVHLVRYGGILAPHSTLRAAIVPTPRQQGVDGEKTKTGTPYWSWARLLGRVFDLDMTTCPFCRRGSLRVRWRPSRLPSPPPVVAKSYARSTKPTLTWAQR